MNIRFSSIPLAFSVILFTTVVSLAGFGFARAATIDIDQNPLFLVGSVDPNIMLMIDNSGSMSNIVPDTPYDSTVTYGCPSSLRLPNTSTVSLRVNYAGYPYIRFGSTDYHWGTTSGNGTNPSRPRQCFDPSLQYDAALYANDYNNSSGTSNDYSYYSGGYLDSSYSGNYLNWYFGSNPTNNNYNATGGTAPDWGNNPSSSPIRNRPSTKQRMEIAKSASKGLIDSLEAANRVGLSTYNGSNGGRLLEAVEALTSTKRASIKVDIDALTPSGMTPLAETLSDIGRYFAMKNSPSGPLNQNNDTSTVQLTLHPGEANETTKRLRYIFGNDVRFANGTGLSDAFAPPVQFFCQKSFAVLLTDGRATEDRAITPLLCDYDGDSNGNCSNYDKKAGQEYESSNGSDYLDDVAMALYEMDLRPDLLAPDDALDDKNNVTTFMIGFADDQVINDPLMQDTAGNGGGLFLPAGNEEALIRAFNIIATSIKQARPSAAALAANSTSLDIGAVVYQAVFDSTDWSGDLIAYPVGTNGQVSINSPYWNASSKLTNSSARKIFTFDPTKTIPGVDFQWASLAQIQKDSLNIDPNNLGTPDTLGADRLAWLRGDHAKEARNGGTFRNRLRSATQQAWILGDIVNSDPVFMYAADYGYASLGVTAEASAYAAYKLDKADGTPIIFIGGNDGMLHAFRADTVDSRSGQELFAYVPNAVYPNLSKLSAIDYTHQYFVDGSPAVGDAYFNDAWHTMLVSGLGAGGRSVFGLDVTDFATNKAEDVNPTAAAVVKWEVSDADDMGLTYSKPQIGRLNNGEWAAIFGNGYNSPNERAYLYIVNIETGAIIKKICAGTTAACNGTGNGNGLSTPTLYDEDGDKIIDTVYAGDLKGNMWKFDLSGDASTSWGLAYGETPLFTASRTAGQVQPITAQPVLGPAPPDKTGVMVYFGTGQYLQQADIANQTVQTFYGIWDNGSTLLRSQLQQQRIESQVTQFDSLLRTTSSETLEWNTERGWYIDLDSVAGERVVSPAQLRYDRVIFLTVIPSNQVCVPGGSSWLMELDSITGASPSEAVFDLNNDGNFDAVDNINGSVVSGYRTTVGITKPPAWFVGTPQEGFDVIKDYKVMTGTTGGIQSLGNRGGSKPPPLPPGAFSRTYWLQIQ